MGFFIQPRFWTLENPWPVCLFKISGVFKEYKDFRFKLYQNLSCNTCQNLGVFDKNYVFRHQKLMAYLACQNLGVFKECNFGLNCIKIRGLTPVKILGYFSRTRFFNTKTPWPVWLVKISGFIWSWKIWTYILRNSRCKTCQNLGVFIRTRFFDNKSLWPTWLVKILGFLRVQRFWADIVSKSLV